MARNVVLIGINLNDRTAEEKAELKNLGSMANLMAALGVASSLRKAAIEAKQENDKACNEVEKYVKSTVDSIIEIEYDKGAEKTPADRREQVVSGLENIKQFMKVAVKDVEHHYAALIMSEEFKSGCNSNQEIEEMVNHFSSMKARSTKLKVVFGGEDEVTDKLLVTTLCNVVVKEKDNNIEQDVHNAINKAKLSTTPVLWDDFSKEISSILKTLSITKTFKDQLKTGNAKDGSAFAAKVQSADAADLKAIQTRLDKLEVQGSSNGMAFNANGGGQQTIGSNGYGGGYGQGAVAMPPNMGFGGGFNMGGFNHQAFVAGMMAAGATHDTRGICYSHQKGNCTRGDTCRFQHTTPAGAGAVGQAAAAQARINCQYGKACTSRFCTYEHPQGKNKERPGTPTKKRK
jgi:hypothetical protein